MDYERGYQLRVRGLEMGFSRMLKILTSMCGGMKEELDQEV